MQMLSISWRPRTNRGSAIHILSAGLAYREDIEGIRAQGPIVQQPDRDSASARRCLCPIAVGREISVRQ
jgi:hypothetical protein